MSISRIFDISKRSLLSHQSAIDITAKNIANVNTEGYKRRRVDLSKLGFGFSSITGALKPEGVIRVRQRFAESQIWYENQNLGKYQTDEMLLIRVEDIFGEPRESGLANVLTQFWNAWNDLANDPESQSVRALVRDKGVLLAGTFKRLHSDLRDFQRRLNVEIQDKVDQINQIIRQVRTVNQQAGVAASNELLDKRDLLINDLSRLLNIEVRENDDGGVTISSGGQILVSGNTSYELTADVSMENGLLVSEVRLKTGGRKLPVTTGELGSLLETINRRIPEQIDKLDQLARTVVDEVNRVHAAGYNLDGVTGINFFKEGITRADEMQVSEEILEDESFVATAAGLNAPGDGSIAQAIADLQYEQVIEGNRIAEFYNQLISNIGGQVQEAEFLRNSQEMVVRSLENQRDAVSGVSLDEEMTRLLEYERAYQAAARMITAADEMVQTILNLV
jgi:flagellar hook-associated protein 1 FlgK